MSIERMEALFNEEMTVDGQMLDPVIFSLALQIFTTIVAGCKGKASAHQMAMVARKPTPPVKRKFRSELIAELGRDEYRARGGPRYADKMFAAAAKLKLKEAKELVEQVSQ
jgi:hypothetical protein